MNANQIKRLTVNSLLAAMCAVLGQFSLDFGNLKFTFESLPVLLGAMLFGPVDGLAVGGIGTLLYQLARYGVTVTTPLWILPYALCGLLTGLYAKKRGFALNGKQTAFIVFAMGIMIFLLNTGALYIDSKVYGYYSFVYVFGSFVPRVLIALAKAAAFTALLPSLLRAGRRALGMGRKDG